MNSPADAAIRFRLRLVALLAAGLVVAAAACTDEPGRVTDAERAVPEDAGAPTDPFPYLQIEPVDARAVVLAPVSGRPQEAAPVEVLGGEARIQGTVAHLGALVPGATVQIERFEGVNAGSLQIVSDATGSWTFDGIKGGRYRIRAWTEELQLPQALTLFLREDESVTLALDLVEPPPELGLDYEVFAVSTPSPAVVGESAQVRIVVNRKLTADDEELLTVPVADTEVRVAGHEGWDLPDGDTGRTDSFGSFTLRAVCRDTDAPPFVLQVGEDETQVDAPRCAEPAAQAETPDTVAFAVGQRFTPPFEGPLPAGVYRATVSSCTTTFERWDGDGWEAATARGRVIELSAPGRRFRAGSGTTACTFERVA